MYVWIDKTFLNVKRYCHYWITKVQATQFSFICHNIWAYWDILATHKWWVDPCIWCKQWHFDIIVILWLGKCMCVCETSTVRNYSPWQIVKLHRSTQFIDFYIHQSNRNNISSQTCVFHHE